MMTAAGLDWHADSAHSAIYDAERTAALFCTICNRFRFMYEEAIDRAPELTAPEAGEAPADSSE